MDSNRKSDDKESSNPRKIASACDVEALKKCLEENKGDRKKCQHHIEAFKTSETGGRHCKEFGSGFVFDYFLRSRFGCSLFMSVELPTLDISRPFDPSSLSSLSQACQEWGFFRVINHGISKDLCMKMKSFSSRVFSLPSEVKNKAGPSSDVKTYTPHFIASPFFESIRVSGPDFFGSGKSSSQVLMNEPNSEFSETLQEYGSTMTRLSKRILETVLKSMGSGFDVKYLSEFKNCHGYMRINNYSPFDCLDNQETEGLGMHTDMSCFTIVYQDEIGGLQVRSKEGHWMDIDSQEDTLVVNIGDLMQAWSNGKFRSSKHRVVLRKKASRFSIAFFWCFEDEKVVFAPEEVAGLRVYKPFVCGDYLKFRESSEKGKFEKVGFTVNHFAGIEM